MARTKVARARLTPEEYEKLERDAREAGAENPSEYLRSLIVGHQAQMDDLQRRVNNLSRRVEHVEEQLALYWRTREVP